MNYTGVVSLSNEVIPKILLHNESQWSLVIMIIKLLVYLKE